MSKQQTKVLGTARKVFKGAYHLVDASGRPLCNTNNKVNGLFDEKWNPDFGPERVNCQKCIKILQTTLRYTRPR